MRTISRQFEISSFASLLWLGVCVFVCTESNQRSIGSNLKVAHKVVMTRRCRCRRRHRSPTRRCCGRHRLCPGRSPRHRSQSYPAVCHHSEKRRVSFMAGVYSAAISEVYSPADPDCWASFSASGSNPPASSAPQYLPSLLLVWRPTLASCIQKHTHAKNPRLVSNHMYPPTISSHSPNDIRVLVVLAVRVPPTAVHHRGVHIGWRVCVRLVQQRDHRQQNRAYVLRGIPPFARQFAALRIIDGRMQDRNAQVAVLFNARVLMLAWCLCG